MFLKANQIQEQKEARFAETITVNGNSFPMPTDPRVSLLDFLRHDVGLTGTKEGCDHGL